MRWELGLREKSAAVRRLLLQAAGGAAAAREVQGKSTQNTAAKKSELKFTSSTILQRQS